MVGLFGNLLGKKYPDFKGEIPFNELLDWDLWPGFMKIIGTNTKDECYFDMYHVVLCVKHCLACSP